MPDRVVPVKIFIHHTPPSDPEKDADEQRLGFIVGGCILLMLISLYVALLSNDLADLLPLAIAILPIVAAFMLLTVLYRLDRVRRYSCVRDISARCDTSRLELADGFHGWIGSRGVYYGNGNIIPWHAFSSFTAGPHGEGILNVTLHLNSDSLGANVPLLAVLGGAVALSTVFLLEIAIRSVIRSALAIGTTAALMIVLLILTICYIVTAAKSSRRSAPSKSNPIGLLVRESDIDILHWYCRTGATDTE